MSRPTDLRYPDGKKIRLYTRIGECVREMRRAHGVSVARLASTIDVSVSTLQKIETASLPPPVWVLAAIADVFDCTLDELVPVIADDEAAA
jgi:transcriptional regulator with XRE-family HTH domain